MSVSVYLCVRVYVCVCICVLLLICFFKKDIKKKKHLSTLWEEKESLDIWGPECVCSVDRRQTWKKLAPAECQCWYCVLEMSQFFPQPPQPGRYLLPEDSAEDAPIEIS